MVHKAVISSQMKSFRQKSIHFVTKRFLRQILTLPKGSPLCFALKLIILEIWATLCVFYQSHLAISKSFTLKNQYIVSNLDSRKTLIKGDICKIMSHLDTQPSHLVTKIVISSQRETFHHTISLPPINKLIFTKVVIFCPLFEKMVLKV